MKQIIINGKFMADRMQGMIRYSRELLKALDLLLVSYNEDNNRHGKEQLKITLVVPSNAKEIPCYENINVLSVGKNTGIKWEQTDLRKYVNANKGAVCFNTCNVAPLGIAPGITTVHDIMYKTMPGDFKTLRNRVSRLWHILQYNYVFSHEKVILTDSEYSKKEIIRYYPKAKEKIRIVPASWQHVLDYKDNPDWQSEYPFLVKGEFFFSLSTLSGHKNGQWIVETAKKNPQAVFAIAGKYYELADYEIPDNVHFLGFVSDEDACSLIKNCRAFIHPASYEGFGLPPLEALALGAKVISSDATSLPEVLDDSVYYINPNEPCDDIEHLLAGEVGNPNDALDKWSWSGSAKMLLELFNIV